VELLKEAHILSDSRQEIPMQKFEYKCGLNSARIERAYAKTERGPRKVRVYTEKEVATKREKYLRRNRQAAHKCRENKKTYVTGLLARAKLITISNAKLRHDIVQTMLELEGLKTIAIKHCGVCPNPSPELAACVEKWVARL
jgi:hypothetical protein